MRFHHARVIAVAAVLVGIGTLFSITHLDAQTPGEVRAQDLRVRADQGNAVAEYTLGLMYANGRGVEQDYEKATELFKLAAEEGDEDAKAALENLITHAVADSLAHDSPEAQNMVGI